MSFDFPSSTTQNSSNGTKSLPVKAVMIGHEKWPTIQRVVESRHVAGTVAVIAVGPTVAFQRTLTFVFLGETTVLAVSLHDQRLLAALKRQLGHVLPGVVTKDQAGAAARRRLLRSKERGSDPQRLAADNLPDDGSDGFLCVLRARMRTRLSSVPRA
jgi:hypothetical protein